MMPEWSRLWELFSSIARNSPKRFMHQRQKLRRKHARIGTKQTHQRLRRLSPRLARPHARLSRRPLQQSRQRFSKPSRRFSRHASNHPTQTQALTRTHAWGFFNANALARYRSLATPPLAALAPGPLPKRALATARDPGFYSPTGYEYTLSAKNIFRVNLVDLSVNMGGLSYFVLVYKSHSVRFSILNGLVYIGVSERLVNSELTFLGRLYCLPRRDGG